MRRHRPVELELVLVLTLLLLVIAAGAGCGTDEVSFHESAPAESKGHLEIEMVQGNVEVRSHAASEIRVDASARGSDAGRIEFSLEGEGDRFELSSEVGAGIPVFPIWLDVELDVHVQVPEGFSVELETEHGEVRLLDIGGDAHVDASRSAVVVDGVQGDLRVETSRAPVEIQNVQGRIEVESSRGPIDVRGADGPVIARTSRQPVRVQFVSQPSGEIETSRAPVDVFVTPDAAFDLVAATKRGSVHVSPELGVRNGDRSEVDARVHGGGRRLAVSTSRDDIRIRTDP